MNLLRTLLLSVGLATSLLAQGAASTEGTIATRSGILPVAGVSTANGPDVPAPPRRALEAPPPKRMPPLVLTPGAARDLAPGAPTTPGGGAAPFGGNLVLVDNHAASPAGASISQITEPTTVIHRDTAFYTANWFAASSTDAGQTWTHINPYTKFPAADGGFCCDQYALYVPGDDSTCMVIWLLQYGYSATTQSGRHRIAVSVGRQNLQQGIFHYYDLSPQLAGFPTQRWFDFPHVARTTNWFYVASNVFDQNNVFQGTTVIRINLNDMRRAIAASWNGATTDSTQPGSHRLAEGAPTTMYYGTHTRDIFGAPMIRIFSWDESSATVTFRDRLISAWYNGTSTAPGPDNRDWLGMDDHRILGAYFASGAVSFMWGSSAGGGFARPFVRIAGFLPAQNYNVAGEASVWHPTIAWAYPSVAGNAAGNVGGTMCFGGGGNHPGTVAFVVDGLSGWGPMANVPFATGASGPASNRWGDYHAATRHPQFPNTYVGTGFALDAQGRSVPRYVWFGRENDVPNMATLNVASLPAGVALTVDVADRNGNRGGVTNFARTYSAVQGMTWTAPATANVGGVSYTFERWRLNATLQPVGQQALTIADLSVHGLFHTIEARYVPVRRTLTVVSTPASGALVSVNPPDLNNRLQGTTQFTLEYSDGANFSAFAPATLGNGVFERWLVDGVPRTAGATTLALTVVGDHLLTARYRVPLCGAFTAFGQSCNTSLGYQHMGSSSRPTCGPWIGDSVNYGVVNAYTNASAALFVGASRTLWNGIPLPLPVPNQPGCSIYTDMLVTLPFATTGFPGSGGINGLVLPNNPGLVNARLFTQCLVLSQLGFHQWSNGLETLIGGFP